MHEPRKEKTRSIGPSFSYSLDQTQINSQKIPVYTFYFAIEIAPSFIQIIPNQTQINSQKIPVYTFYFAIEIAPSFIQTIPNWFQTKFLKSNQL